MIRGPLRRRTDRVPPRPDLPQPAPTPRWGLRVVALLVVASLVASSATVLLASGWFDDPAGAHAFLSRRPDGAPYRWDPCEPIRFAVNTADAPDGAVDDVREAVARVSEATGIEFVDEGITSRTAAQQEAAAYREVGEGDFLPVLISWEQGADYATLTEPSSVAVGVPITDDEEPSWVYRSGSIVVNAGYPMATGFASRDSLGPTLMHEWGHVLGLGHVADGGELMWSPDVRGADPFPAAMQSDWGEGDLAGLRELGRSAGCVPT